MAIISGASAPEIVWIAEVLTSEREGEEKYFWLRSLTDKKSGLKYATRCSNSNESPDLVVMKIFSTRVLTVEKSASKIPHPASSESAKRSSEKRIKNIFEKAWQREFESYNSQTRQLERATNCSLKIDQRTDKREYPVDAKMTQEA